MNNDEELISNISYTNSDFRTIYPELLDTAKKLTNKWDPSLSNEADPGVVLLKENAMIADKNNYHIDKNVLECFPLSCTQQASARQLYDLAGYNMHWYKSGICNITFSLLDKLENIKDEEGNSVSGITIPNGTQIVDSTGEFIYSTLQKSNVLNNSNKSVVVPAIQGKINKYEINGNSTITIDNLDEDLRLYFPESFVAQNGIFVCEAGSVPNKFENDIPDENNSNIWKIVNNLSAYPARSKIFKFGVSVSNNNCYIQFPEDISTLIGNGLNIYYTTTQGYSGSVKAGVLNTFNEDLLDSTKSVVLNDYIRIYNTASTGAADVETLDEAYRNYKKTIGIFNTLVTRRDYDNAIYNLESSSTSGSLVSNVIAADRTCDMNYSNYIMEWDLNSNHKKLYVDKNNNQDKIQPYDIVLYLLKKPDGLATVKDYNDSFLKDVSPSTLDKIETDLNDIQCVQHDYKYPETDTNFNVENICSLKGILTTFYKITKDEAKDIEKNVRTALIQNYNSREIDFGNELNYNNLLDVIKNADARIRDVSLNIPTYVPTLQTTEENNPFHNLYSTTDSTSKDFNNKMIAKMVLSGNIQLFKIQDDFQFDFGQQNALITRSSTGNNNKKFIKTLTSYVEKTIPTSEPQSEPQDGLRENEIIQIITPSLLTTDTFGTYVKYISNTTIPKNEPIKITSDLQLKLIVTDAATGTEKCILIGKNTPYVGKILETNIDIPATTSTSDKSDWYSLNNFEFDGRLYSNQRIDIKEISNINLTYGTKYYIITNTFDDAHKNYRLVLPQNDDIVLQEGEYFVYVPNQSEDIVILGSGTTLKLTGTDKVSTTLECPIINIDDYFNNVNNLQNIEWKVWNYDYNLSAIENDIVTLGEGDKCWVDAQSINLSDPGNINKLKDISTNGNSRITYKLKSDTSPTTINLIENYTDYTIRVQSRLTIKANNLISQTFLDGQHLDLTLEDDSTISLPHKNTDKTAVLQDSILFNYNIIVNGGTNIDAKVLDDKTSTYKLGLLGYYFKQSAPVEGQQLKRDSDGLLKLKTKDTLKTFTLNYNFSEVDGDDIGTYYVLPINVALGSNITLTLSGPSMSIDGLNGTYATSKSITEDGNYIIIIKSSANITATFDNHSDTNAITFKNIVQYAGINSEEIDSKEIGFDYIIADNMDPKVANSVLSNIVEIDNATNHTYDWSYKVPDEQKVLQPTSGSSYFNINHIYNKYVIPKIDFKNSDIKVNPSSIS